MSYLASLVFLVLLAAVVLTPIWLDHRETMARIEYEKLIGEEEEDEGAPCCEE